MRSKAAARAFAQVSIQTHKGPLGFCVHRYDTNFAALVLADCDSITFERTNCAI
jgi:hypothetical protein